MGSEQETRHYPRHMDAKSLTFLFCAFAGKTSLLNALCGRAHYGVVTGDIKINGQKSSIEENADSVGFVPQVGPGLEAQLFCAGQ